MNTRVKFSSLVAICILLLAGGGALAAADKNLELQARRLISALGCKGCHSFDGDGGTLAPALDLVGLRRSPAEIIKQLMAHDPKDSDDFMPSYASTPAEELKIISEFLYRQANPKQTEP